MGRVEGKIALVTGAAMGLGFADAKMLVDEGATVILTYVNEEAGAAAAAELGEGASFMKLDVSSETEWQDVMKAVKAAHGGLDVLVNNTGVMRQAGIEAMSMADWAHDMAVNLTAPFLMIRAALPHLRAARGRIVNI